MIVSTQHHTYVTPDDSEYCTCDDDSHKCQTQDYMDRGFYHDIHTYTQTCQRKDTDWDFTPTWCAGLASWWVKELGLRVCDTCLPDAIIMARDTNDYVHVASLDFSIR